MKSSFLQNDLSCSIITKVSKVILRDCSVEDIWDCIRIFLKSENERAKSAAVGIFGTEHKQIVSDLEQYARNSVVTSVKLLFRNVEKHLRERLIHLMQFHLCRSSIHYFIFVLTRMRLILGSLMPYRRAARRWIRKRATVR